VKIQRDADAKKKVDWQVACKFQADLRAQWLLLAAEDNCYS